jgi:hypothetical protein
MAQTMALTEIRRLLIFILDMEYRELQGFMARIGKWGECFHGIEWDDFEA